MKSSNNKNDFQVRLSRTSSALGLMKERRKSVIQLQDIVDENKSYDTVTGKLPVEAALVIMKRVHQEAGVIVNEAGHTANDKLLSYKPEPALDVLKEKTWREFFTNKTNSHLALANSYHNAIPNNHNALSNDTEFAHKKQLEVKKNLEEVFHRLLKRVEYYWDKLKIPIADQTFYRKSLCKAPVTSFDQCREISSYIYMLKLHEEATIQVIQAIQSREISIAKAFDVFAALQRKVSRGLYSHNSRDKTGGAGGTLHMSDDQFLGTSGTGGSERGRGGGVHKNQLNHSNNNSILSISKNNDFKSSNFWKEELLNSFEDVRMITLEVIKKIQHWRRNLWRPHPFIYMGQNYLSKMKYDLMILESDMYLRILALLPLKYEDLQCIVFISGTNNSAKSLNSTSRILSSSSPQHIIGKQLPLPSLSSPSLYNVVHSKINAVSNNNNNNNNNHSESFLQPLSTPNQQQLVVEPPNIVIDQQYDKYIEQLIIEFMNRYDHQELDAAAMIVIEEDLLQNALSIEQNALSQKGVFIPTLRLKPLPTEGFEESMTSKGGI